MTRAQPTFQDIRTQLIHAGRPRPGIEGAVVHPIFQSANYLMADESDYGDLRYIRLHNSPNHRVLHDRLAALESAEAALVTASGMAAITGTLLAFLKNGDHVLAHQTLYGGAQSFLSENAAALGIQSSSIDMANPETWKPRIRDNTKMIYVEGISNPLMEVGDLKAVVAFAKEHDLVSIIDNTFPTPINFRPIEIGFDLVMHSATKYLNGHSDIVAGAVSGSREHIDRIRETQNHLGGALDPHACFLLERGLKTLALRVERQNDNAAELARFLSTQEPVREVQYPGLDSHPGHRFARELFSGYGGMLSFYTHTAEQAKAFLRNVRIPLHAPSLGSVETLVVQPSRSSHLGLTTDERARQKLTDELIRVSVGIESIDDLKGDFEEALRNV